MTRIFDQSLDYQGNISALERALGHSVSKTTSRQILLTKTNGEKMTLRAGPGKFVSCALMQYLGEGRSFFVINEERHQIVREFYGTTWDELGHLTIDFLREPGVTVRVELED